MVAIKDFDMPSCCSKCELEDYHDILGQYCFKLAERIPKDKRDVGKLPDCPLVEIEERKKGKWICVHHIENKITYDSWKCSECQHDFNSEEESMVDFDEYKYCPNCGAEMRGSENEVN